MVATPESDIDPSLLEMVVAFVDREAGLDAPLSADDEKVVRQLIENDPIIHRLADDLRATNAGLEALLDDVDTVEVPGHLADLIVSAKCE